MFKESLRYYRQLSIEAPGLEVAAVRSAEQLLNAKKLHARIYRANGYVTDAHLTSDGLYIGYDEDPYQAHCQYFSVERVRDGTRHTVATSRLIQADAEKGYRSFQTYENRKFYPRYLCLLEQLDPAKCAEISALVKEPGETSKATLMLYRIMWHYSLENEYLRLLISCDTRLYRRCKAIFGDSWIRVGPEGYFKGHNVVPVMIDIPNSLDEALKVSRINPIKRHLKIKALEFFLRGLPDDVVRPSQRAKIERYHFETVRS